MLTEQVERIVREMRKGDMMDLVQNDVFWRKITAIALVLQGKLSMTDSITCAHVLVAAMKADEAEFASESADAKPKERGKR